MLITRALASAGVAAAYCTDQRAIQKGAPVDGLFVGGDPVLDGFRSPREVPEAICLQLVLDDGQVAIGDGTGVSFPGRAGVDPPVRALEQIRLFNELVVSHLLGVEFRSFRDASNIIDRIVVDDKPLPSALRWGISTALLDAMALARHVTKAEVLASEWGTSVSATRPAFLAQSSQDWEISLDRAIMRRIDVYHRSSHNHRMWLDHPRALSLIKARLARHAPDHRMDVQLDLNGFAGREFNFSVDRIVSYMSELQELVLPSKMIYASPVEMADRDTQAAAMSDIRRAMQRTGLPSELIADYHCASVADHEVFARLGAADYHMIHAPTIGSVKDCMDLLVDLQGFGVKRYLAGTATSTEVSGLTIAHMAAACTPDLLALTPGPGVDTAHSITVNELSRIAVLAGIDRNSADR